MKDRLSSIAKSESCVLRDDQLDAILQLAEGDMRRAVQTLQSVNALLGQEGSKSSLDEEAIAELAGLPPPKVVDNLFEVLRNSKGVFGTVQDAVQDICLEGYSAQTLLGSFLQRLVQLPDDQIDELGRSKLAIRIAEAEHCMMDGADEYLQLMSVCGLAMQCFESTARKMATQ